MKHNWSVLVKCEQTNKSHEIDSLLKLILLKSNGFFYILFRVSSAGVYTDL